MIFLANHLIYHTMGLAMALVGLWNGPHTWCHWLCVVPYADAGQRDGPTCWSWCVGRGASNFMGFLLVYIYILVISKWAKYPGGAPPLILTDPISMADFLLNCLGPPRIWLDIMTRHGQGRAWRFVASDGWYGSYNLRQGTLRDAQSHDNHMNSYRGVTLLVDSPKYT